MMYTDKELYPSCPTMGWDCPYIDNYGFCKMFNEEGVTPYDECDAWYGIEWEDEDE